jgi:PDZ domain-containing protein
MIALRAASAALVLAALVTLGPSAAGAAATTAAVAPSPSANRLGVTFLNTAPSRYATLIAAMYAHFKTSAGSLGFTVVPIDVGISDDERLDPSALCRQLHVNGILLPLFSGSVGDKKVESTVELELLDCGGESVWDDTQSATTQASEVGQSAELANPSAAYVGAGNSAADDAVRALGAYTSDPTFKSLLATGINADATSSRYLSLFQASLNDAGAIVVEHVFPGGPASVAGLRRGDEIASINGQPFSKANADAFDTALDAPVLVMSLRRSGQAQSVTVKTMKYPELLASIKPW